MLLKTEINRITEYYQNKIQLLEQQIEDLEQKSIEKATTLRSEYNQEIERLVEQHQVSIVTITKEHNNTIEYIRKNKLVENSVIIENSSFSTLLRQALEKFEEKSTDLLEVQNFLKNQFDLQINLKEAEMKSKEHELKRKFKKLEHGFEASGVTIKYIPYAFHEH